MDGGIMTTKISGTGFNSLTVGELVLTTPLAEQYGGSGSTGVYKMGYATPKSATGTFVDFTDIPSWAKRITVMFAGVSTNGTSQIEVRLGSASGVDSTGYFGSASGFGTTALITVALLTGIKLRDSNAAAISLHATTEIVYIAGSTYAFNVVSGLSDQAGSGFSSGTKTLSGKLSQIRITTVNGTDLFDAGTINVMWEGF